MDGEQTWREQRRAAAAAAGAALAREKAIETAQARRLIAAFVQEMTVRQVAPHRLRAPVADRKLSYRTGLTGWYLRRNRSVAVDVSGEFYLLEARPSLRSWLFGARVVPADPPLRVGVGARDGESMPLDRLLRQRLEAGTEFG